MTDLIASNDLTYSDWTPADSSEFLTECVPNFYHDPSLAPKGWLPCDAESRTPPNRTLLEWARRPNNAPPREWYEDSDDPFSPL